MFTNFDSLKCRLEKQISLSTIGQNPLHTEDVAHEP
jgi:hypothetical protein